jgi:DNA polymerase-1
MPETLYLIDGHAQIYRAFYAIEGLTAPDGRPTGAIFGFVRMLLDLLRRHEPDYVAAAFDPKEGRSFRHETYPEYKATRKPMPDELREQVPRILELVEAFRIPVVQRENFEADDLLGTLARQGAEAGLDVVLVTSDKDCRQLLGPRVRMYDPRKDAYVTADSLEETEGIPPALVTDYMGLVGDTADNIPGVAGIGPKTARDLLATYGSLEELLAHADEIKGKRGATLRDSADVARLSRTLATIDTDAPVAMDRERFRRTAPDAGRIRQIFEEHDFQSLLRDLDAGDGGRDDRPLSESADYAGVATPDAFDAFLRELRTQAHIAFDTETTSQDPMRAELVGMSFAWAEGAAHYLPFRAPEGEPVLGSEALDAVGAVLADASVTKTGQNLKYDAIVCRRHGIELRGIAFDSLLASGIVNGHLTEHGLDALALRHLGIRKTPTSDLIGKGKKQIPMSEVPLGDVTAYACEDADVAWRLERVLGEELDRRDERRLLEELELPLSRVLTEMQLTGIRVDRDRLAALSRTAGAEIEALTETIHRAAGREFNVASPVQLRAILFEEMGLPVITRTKTGPSTSEEALSQLAAMGHELPALVLEYRQVAKLKNTYLDALPALVHPETGRIHATFSQTTTATGRLSSRDPNLQNIPVRTERGRPVRAAFVPEAGWTMLAADYSQVELRMLAHCSGDARLADAFHAGRDIHRVVAADVHGVEEEEVTDGMRSAAKAVNFGIIYGQTAHGLSQQTGMTRPQAQLFIDSYFEQFPGVLRFIEATREQAHADGFVRTRLGRRRLIPDLASRNKARRQAAERMAVNTVIQGSAADLIKLAMIRLDRRLREEGLAARMLLQIHDELLLECPPEETDRLRAVVTTEMESAMALDVPLVVDAGAGANWLEAK